MRMRHRSYQPITTTVEDQKTNLLDMQLGRINAFKAQDVDEGNFDVTFDLSGKLLYAHKIFITTVSTTLETWISERWSSKDAAIKIETFTYEEFYEFLLFLYSGTCQITEDNAFRLIDMAEFFDVAVMKEHCDSYLSKLIPNIATETVDEMMEMVQKYSLSKSIGALNLFIRQNMQKIIKTDGFIQFKRPFLDVLFSAEKTTAENQQLFLSVVKWAEYQVSTKKPTLEGTDFLDAVKEEFDEMKSKFNFSKMKFDFVLESVVSKDYLFSTFECCKILGKFNRDGSDEEKYLKTIFEIAERQALNQQKASFHENFNLQNAIKREFSEIFPSINFKLMTLDFVKEFLVDKAFLFSSKEVYGILAKCQRSDEEKYLRAMFEFAKSESLKQQATSVDENFNLQDVMKKKVSKILPLVDFKHLKLDFVKQFVDEKALISSKESYKIIAKCQRTDDKESEVFEMLYELAKKNVEKKQSSEKIVDLPNAIKTELAECLPRIKFHKMGKKYVIDFAAKTGFISREQAISCFYTRVKIRSGKKLLTGCFDDIYKILNRSRTRTGWCHDMTPRSENKLRFTGLKFAVPSSSSPIQKMCGVHWYLLLEKDGTLAVKHQVLIKRGEYLIAELRSTEEFSFALKKKTQLIVSRNTIF